MPAETPPTTSTCFRTAMVARANNSPQHGRTIDHTLLQGKHLIYAATMLWPFTTHLSNGTLIDGFQAKWTTYTIVPIHKARYVLDLGNYMIIMIVYISTKLCGGILETKLCTCAEAEGMHFISFCGGLVATFCPTFPPLLFVVLDSPLSSPSHFCLVVSFFLLPPFFTSPLTCSFIHCPNCLSLSHGH